MGSSGAGMLIRGTTHPRKFAMPQVDAFIENWHMIEGQADIASTYGLCQMFEYSGSSGSCCIFKMVSFGFDAVALLNLGGDNVWGFVYFILNRIVFCCALAGGTGHAATGARKTPHLAYLFSYRDIHRVTVDR